VSEERVDRECGWLDYAVPLGALLVDPEVANHLTDVPKFDIVELGQSSVEFVVVGDDSAVIRQSQCVPRSTLV